MGQQLPEPRTSDDGVIFNVVVDSINYECCIKDEALQHLSAMRNIDAADANSMEVFSAFERSISGVARRLVAAGVKARPIVITRHTFSEPPRAR